jgi:DNA-binding PadR family transcriptional regulator
MRKYLQTIAANTAGTPTHKVLYDAAGIGRHTATSYDDLLDTLMITQRVPARAGNRTDRAVRLPKLYLIDPGLFTALLRVDQRRILRDGDLLGRTLDTSVATHLRAECSLSITGADLFHLRDANGRHEVDLLVETRDGHVIAIEVKATAAPSRADARQLEWCAPMTVARSSCGSANHHPGPRPGRRAAAGVHRPPHQQEHRDRPRLTLAVPRTQGRTTDDSRCPITPGHDLGVRTTAGRAAAIRQAAGFSAPAHGGRRTLPCGPDRTAPHARSVRFPGRLGSPSGRLVYCLSAAGTIYRMEPAHWAQLRRGLLRYCVLTLVARRPYYGLEMTERLQALGGPTISSGTIYPLLNRLRRDGLVTTTWSESSSGPPRRYYSATPEGVDEAREFQSAWSPFVSAISELLESGERSK